jgi:hypothetical protein
MELVLVLVLLATLNMEVVLAVPRFTVERAPVDFLTAVPGLGEGCRGRKFGPLTAAALF